MKKLTLLAALLIVFSASSFATEGKPGKAPKFKMIAKTDVKYDLYYSSENSGEVCVIIYDESGKKISSQTMKEVKKFKRTYDFSQLAPGKYKVVVRNDDGSANQQISHLIKEARLKTFVTKLPESNALKLHVGDFDEDQPVTVKIYNENYKLIHSDEIKNAQSFSRVYNLNNIELKSVSVLVENGGEKQTFIHSFR